MAAEAPNSAVVDPAESPKSVSDAVAVPRPPVLPVPANEARLDVAAALPPPAPPPTGAAAPNRAVQRGAAPSGAAPAREETTASEGNGAPTRPSTDGAAEEEEVRTGTEEVAGGGAVTVDEAVPADRTVAADPPGATAPAAAAQAAGDRAATVDGVAAADDAAAADMAGDRAATADATGDRAASVVRAVAADEVIAADGAVAADGTAELEAAVAPDGPVAAAGAPGRGTARVDERGGRPEDAGEIGDVAGLLAQGTPGGTGDRARFAAGAVLDVLRAAGWMDAAAAARLGSEAERMRELLDMVVRDHRAREATAADVESRQLHWLVPLLRAAHGVAFGTLGAKVVLRTAMYEVPPHLLASAGVRLPEGDLELDDQGTSTTGQLDD
jgi:hypothetical protein